MRDMEDTTNNAIGSEAFPETADIETASADYAGRFAGAVGRWFLAVQARTTLELMSSRPPAEVLDVGGGHGQLARPLSEQGFAVTVLGSAASCGERIADLTAGGRCTFRVGNVVALPFEDDAFDAVLSFRLLPHCDRWPTLIAELCRTARTEVVVDYPAVTGLNACAPALFAAKKSIERNTRHWRQFRHAEVADAFRANGFAPAGRRGQFFWPMALHRALRCRTLSGLLEGTAGLPGLRSRWGSPVVARFAKERPPA